MSDSRKFHVNEVYSGKFVVISVTQYVVLRSCRIDGALNLVKDEDFITMCDNVIARDEIPTFDNRADAEECASVMNALEEL